MNESGQRSVLVGSSIQEVLYMVYSKDATLPKIKGFFPQKKRFAGLDPLFLISECFLAWFGEVRKRFELLLLCNKPTPLVGRPNDGAWPSFVVVYLQLVSLGRGSSVEMVGCI